MLSSSLYSFSLTEYIRQRGADADAGRRPPRARARPGARPVEHPPGAGARRRAPSALTAREFGNK